MCFSVTLRLWVSVNEHMELSDQIGKGGEALLQFDSVSLRDNLCFSIYAALSNNQLCRNLHIFVSNF